MPVAQLDRVFGYEPKGQGFESLQARQSNVYAFFAYTFFVLAFSEAYTKTKHKNEQFFFYYTFLYMFS